MQFKVETFLLADASSEDDTIPVDEHPPVALHAILGGEPHPRWLYFAGYIKRAKITKIG